MNRRQRKKQLKKWCYKHNLEELLYCLGCGKKLDIKRNEYALKHCMCNQSCYEKTI